jgi:DNA-binding transcriptional ArsR family regulator
MAGTNWNRQFFVSTRGRIITLLRRSSRTVDELAQALDLTHTAVRAHLAALERDGLVHQHSERRGGKKPSAVYELAPAAEELFPKSYGQLLDQLLDVLQGRMTPEEVETLLREVGRRMAAQWKLPPAERRVRLEAAVNVFQDLAGWQNWKRVTGRPVFAGIGARLRQWCQSIQQSAVSPRRCSQRWWECPCSNTANERLQCHVASSCSCDWSRSGRAELLFT